MFQKILLTVSLLLLVIIAAGQNDVGIGTSSPAARLDVQGNGIGYDVLMVANDKDAVPDSILILSKRGHLAIGVVDPGTYKISAVGSPSAFAPQIEVWDGDPLNPAAKMLADINDMGGANGVFGLYLAGAKKLELRAAGASYFDGPVGFGIAAPQEKLHLAPLDGAIVLGSYVSPLGAEVAGTIEFNGTQFVGWTGPGTWVDLDVQSQPDNDWLIGVNSTGSSELTPFIFPSSLSLASPANPNSFALTWLTDLASPGMYPIQLMLETDAQNALPYDAAMIFRRSDWSVASPPAVLSEYWMGIYNSDNSFMVSNASPIAPAAQADNVTMIRSAPTGIVGMMNQSRVRASVVLIDWNSWQLIPAAVWTPVNYTNDGTAGWPGPVNWDQQNEFTVALSPGTTTPPVNSFFTATEEGYYQVNARCEFEPDEYVVGGISNPVYMRPNAYVSIAIYINTGPAGWVRHSIGNNLQITNNLQLTSPPPAYPDATGTMTNNNAPNVSDVIYLQPGWMISIWVFQWSYTPMMLRTGDDVHYVSIHKSS